MVDSPKHTIFDNFSDSDGARRQLSGLDLSPNNKADEERLSEMLLGDST